MHKHYCGLTALGMINALGGDNKAILANLALGESPGMICREGWIAGHSTMLGEVTDELPAIPSDLRQFNCKNNRLILAALKQIEAQLKHCILRFGHDRIGVVIGSSTSGILEGELALKYAASEGVKPDSYYYRQQEIGSPALFVARYLDLSGPTYTVSTACSSSAKAFASARNLLKLDLCDAVIVGGADSLCQLTVQGFNALDSISKTVCNPFSANRDGITIGEGAAIFIMEKELSDINLLGVGSSSDAYHMSAPHPDGTGAITAMQVALQDAGLAAADIDYVNLHGTATAKNDAMESIAVNRVFGDKIPCSSTKPLTGHTLGAAGATEAGLCWLMLTNDAPIPPQCWDCERDDSLAPINILGEAMRLSANKNTSMLSNSFAFGGSNASIILGQ